MKKSQKRHYEFVANGDVFTDGKKKANDYISLDELTYIGHIDTEGEFHFAEDMEYDEARIEEIRKYLRHLIETVHPDEWTPNTEQRIFTVKK